MRSAKSGVQKTGSRTASFVELKWKFVLDEFEISRQRRGRAIEKQGLVTGLLFEHGAIYVQVQGPKMRFAVQDTTVSMPIVQSSEEYQSHIAHLLYLRPDWLAALHSGEWNREFWDALSDMGLEWYPDETTASKWVSGITCTCDDREMPCYHAAAALFALLHEMEDTPLFAVRVLGFNIDDLLDDVHRMGSVILNEEPVTETAGRHQNLEAVLLQGEEEAVYRETHAYAGERMRHRLPPNWDVKKQADWRERYMAWK
ncbi:hypothetical protein JZ785_11560 [Alicyclobacillus curvatus]|nr:hypothetical protein JZ785_11560 [Alicyclobacillus curvatus]